MFGEAGRRPPARFARYAERLALTDPRSGRGSSCINAVAGKAITLVRFRASEDLNPPTAIAGKDRRRGDGRCRPQTPPVVTSRTDRTNGRNSPAESVPDGEQGRRTP
jgi:hypothetical protein